MAHWATVSSRPCKTRGRSVTDHDGLYGVVRFAEAARRADLATVFGAELHLPTPEDLLRGSDEPKTAQWKAPAS